MGLKQCPDLLVDPLSSSARFFDRLCAGRR